MSDGVLRQVLEQVAEAESELRAYPPAGADWTRLGIDWVARAEAAVRVLVPWLAAAAPDLKAYMERVLNAPTRLRGVWRKIRERPDLPVQLVDEFEQHLSDAGLLLEYVTGEVASSIVTTHLLAQFPGAGLRPNGKSDYPDL